MPAEALVLTLLLAFWGRGGGREGVAGGDGAKGAEGRLTLGGFLAGVVFAVRMERDKDGERRGRRAAKSTGVEERRRRTAAAGGGGSGEWRWREESEMDGWRHKSLLCHMIH